MKILGKENTKFNINSQNKQQRINDKLKSIARCLFSGKSSYSSTNFRSIALLRFA